MKIEKCVERERRYLEKIINFRLPNPFLRIGIAVILVAIVLMFIRVFAMDGNTDWLKLVLQKVLLVGLLIVSLSKDKIEDEMMVSLRMQSYTIAFVVGVLYTLIMPYVEFGVSNIVHSGGEVYKDLGDFQTLLFMLMIQIMFYHTFKRYR